jgi:ribosomal-protein-alanine N-acetyltransferase
MTVDDLNCVMDLERQVFSDPWPRSMLVEQLGLKNDDYCSLVAENDQDMIGYACFFFDGEKAHLTNMAVDPQHFRKSVATQLLNRILEAVRERSCEYMVLEVRPSNKAAIALYERAGFGILWRRVDYYHRPTEDAVVMVRYFHKDDESA